MQTVPGDSAFHQLAQSLGLRMQRTGLLRQALTHSSYARENPSLEGHDNERLEFLGDAVLKLVVSDELMKRFPNDDEGRLSKMRAYVVSQRALARAARAVGLEQLLLLGRGAEKTGERRRESVLADAMEAAFGAVYIEIGLDQCRSLIIRVLGEALDSASQSALSINYKEILQEHLQRDGASAPKYEVVDARGPDHDQVFVTVVSHRGAILGTGEGKSKKAATQLAAKAALIKLGIIDEEGHVKR